MNNDVVGRLSKYIQNIDDCPLNQSSSRSNIAIDALFEMLPGAFFNSKGVRVNSKLPSGVEKAGTVCGISFSSVGSYLPKSTSQIQGCKNYFAFADWTKISLTYEYTGCRGRIARCNFI